MRLFLDTLIRWLIAAGLIVGAIAYFKIPADTNWPSFRTNVPAAAILVGAMIGVSAVALQGMSRWLVPLIVAIGMTLGIGAYYRIDGTLDVGWEPVNALVTFVIVLALWLMTFHVLARTHRFLMLVNCWCDPDGVKTWIAELDSPSLLRKSLAVQTLADYLGRGFSGAENWPFAWCRRDELEFNGAIIKRLLAAKEAMLAECPSQRRLLRQLGRKMKTTFGRLAQYRVDWMIRQIPEYFRPDAAEPVAPDDLPEPLTPLDPARLIQTLRDRIRDALEKATQLINDSPAGSLIVDSEESVGEVLAQLLLEAYQAGLLLRMGTPEINPMDLFPNERGSFKKAFHDFAKMMERIGTLLKDGLMDLSFLEERLPPEAVDDELPYMTSEEFVQSMRPHVEQALTLFVEITNQTPHGLILVAEEASVCRVFARLHAQALETGLELRLQRAESLGLLAKWKEKHVAAPHLRKAASPRMPSPIMGWAEKYRCMRIAGTRFPLIHEGPESRNASAPGTESHERSITSVKPGPGEN